jgi:prevent-host-death family protein
MEQMARNLVGRCNSQGRDFHAFGPQGSELGAIFSTMRAASIRPITDLKTHTKEVIDQAIQSGEPVLITQNGRATVVVIDAKRHDDAQATLAMLKLLAQSQDSMARGAKTFSGEEARRKAHTAIEQTSKR